MLEPILVGDNDAYKRKIACLDAQGGAEGAHLRSTVVRDSSHVGRVAAQADCVAVLGRISGHCLLRDRRVR
eukprot:7336571-Prymnesium_polylepis.1